jgi:LysR family transcriptional regulator, low CO2-responsive transcriptional regulator
MQLNSVTLHQLRIFATINKVGSFRKAASKLLLSEPSISQQIKLLERVVGAKLLERGSRQPVRLTQAGRILFESSLEVFSLLERTERDLEALWHVDSGEVRFGANAYFYGLVLPSLCASFREDHPGIAVRGVEGLREELLDEVASGGLDLAIVAGPADRQGLSSVVFAQGDRVLVGPPGHPFVLGAPAPFSALASEELIFRPASWIEDLKRLAVDAGITIAFGWECSTIEAEIEAALSGLGLAVLPYPAVQSHIAEGRLALLRVEGFPIRWTANIAYRPKDQAPSTVAFIRHLVAHRAKIETINRCPEPYAAVDVS